MIIYMLNNILLGFYFTRLFRKLEFKLLHSKMICEFSNVSFLVSYVKLYFKAPTQAATPTQSNEDMGGSKHLVAVPNKNSGGKAGGSVLLNI